MSTAPRSGPTARQWQPLAAVVLVALLPLLLFWRLLTPVDADRAYVVEGDLSSQYYPLRAYAASRLAKGELPLWSPYVYGGQPALADIQTGALYPPSLLWGLIRGEDLSMQDLQLQALLHLSLAAAGMYFLASRLSSSVLGGAVAGIAFSLGGYLTSFPVQQVTILSTAAWLPWLLLALDLTLEGRLPLSRGGVAVAGAVALVALAGHPQTAMLSAYAALGYVLWRRYWLRPPFARLAAAGAGALLGLGLAAGQLLPTLEFIAHSTRARLGFQDVAAGFGLHEIAGLLYPGYFGGTPQYAGVVTLLLALGAATFLPWRQVGYWLGLGLAGLILSFGSGTALGTLAYVLLPGFASSRNQERAILWLALSLAVLAGLGAAQVARGAPMGRAQRYFGRVTVVLAAFAGILLAGAQLPAPDGGVNLFGGFLKQHVWIVAGVGVTALLGRWRARGYVSDRWMAVALTVLLAVNLASVNWSYHLGEPSPAETRPSAGLAERIAARLGPGQRAATGGLLPEGPNAGLMYGFADTTGNTPLALSSYAQFTERVPEWRRWQLLSVALITLPESASPGPDLALAETGIGPGLSLYSVGQPGPALRLVHELERAQGEEVWQRLAAEDFDPSRRAVVSPEAAVSVAPGDSPPVVEYLAWEPERIEADVVVSDPALAVFSLVAYPGWQATVDGRSVPWAVADGLFVGVPVPAGSHEIRLEYRPASFYVGAGISALALALMLVMGIRPRILSRWEPHP